MFLCFYQLLHSRIVLRTTASLQLQLTLPTDPSLPLHQAPPRACTVAGSGQARVVGGKKQTFKDLYLSSISLTFCMSSAARATTRQSVTIPHACLLRHKASLLTFTFSMRRKLKDYSSPCGGNARDRGQLQKQGWRRGCCCCWYRGLHQVTSVMV